MLLLCAGYDRRSLVFAVLDAALVCIPADSVLHLLSGSKRAAWLRRVYLLPRWPVLIRHRSAELHVLCRWPVLSVRSVAVHAVCARQLRPQRGVGHLHQLCPRAVRVCQRVDVMHVVQPRQLRQHVGVGDVLAVPCRPVVVCYRAVDRELWHVYSRSVRGDAGSDGVCHVWAGSVLVVGCVGL